MVAKYRERLPQLGRHTFLSDGGMETTLIFHEGMELPCFASFPLVETAEGRAALEAYYRRYLTIARERGVGFVLDSATWRANPDWGAKLGYDAARLAAINRASIAMLTGLRDEIETRSTPIVVNGAIGPRGDGYKGGVMEPDEAEDYHSPQVAVFADTAADMVTAYTLTNIGEAIGVVRAARAAAMPVVISFTVETNGRLFTGPSIEEAIEETDAATEGASAYYMINCAHPTHFEGALSSGRWRGRIGGLRANASAKSHAELDESETLDAGDSADLAARYRGFVRMLPNVTVLGGCCGTDHRHIEAICEACVPAQAA